MALRPVDEIRLATSEKCGHRRVAQGDGGHVHAADRFVEFFQSPGRAAVFADADGGGVMAAVPLLAGARDASEDRQEPGPVGADRDRGPHEAAAGQVEIAALGRHQARRVRRVDADFGHADPALVLIARRLRRVEQTQPPVGCLKQHRVLLGMIRIGT